MRCSLGELDGVSSRPPLSPPHLARFGVAPTSHRRQLLRAPSLEPDQRARLLSAKAPGAGAWLLDPQARPHHPWTTAQLQDAIRLLLGLPLLYPPAHPACPLTTSCGYPHDSKGAFLFRCPSLLCNVRHRHNTITWLFARYLRAWLGPEATIAVEPPNFRDYEPSLYTQPDLYLVTPGGQRYALDVRVVHPHVRFGAGNITGCTAAYAATPKRQRQYQNLNAARTTLVPVLLEIFGHLGSDARAFLRAIKPSVGPRRRPSLSAFHRDLQRTLWRANALFTRRARRGVVSAAPALASP